MVHSEKFKERMVARMVGPYEVSANALSSQVGVGQPTLSRWLRQAHRVPGMSKKPGKQQKNVVPDRKQGWSFEEKLRAVVESMPLSEDELGAFLRKEGLHEAQLEEWTEAVHSGLTVRKGPKKPSAETKRIKQLERELRRKDKALAETAALLVLQKKVQEIWGDEDDDTEPRSGK
jgi:transposase